MSAELNINKESWPDGPWKQEPDRLHWIDPETNLDCLIVRNRSGALCGYVGVPDNHPWYGQYYSELPADPHGGLTYADRCVGHICHTDEEAANQDVWWIGFDCNHFGDFAPNNSFGNQSEEVYRDIGYVTTEVTNLAREVHNART